MTNKNNRKTGIGLILSWVFGVIFIFGSIGALLSKELIGAFVLFIMGCVLIPPLNRFISKKMKFDLSSKRIKTLIIIIGFVVIAVFIDTEDTTPPTQEIEKQQEIPTQQPTIQEEKTETAKYEKLSGKVITISIPDGAYKPDIWEDKIVFVSKGEAGNFGLHLYDIPTGKTTKLTHYSGTPHIFDNKILWMDDRRIPLHIYDLEKDKEEPFEPNVNVYFIYDFQGDNVLLGDSKVYNFKSGSIIELPMPFPKERASYEKIYGDVVVGHTAFPRDDIFYYDMEKDKVTILNKSYDQKNPSIYENKIVYAENRISETNFDIFMYDIETGEETAITNSDDASESQPYIYGDYIVYVKHKIGADKGFDGREVFNDIWYYNINTKQEVKIPNTQDYWKKDLKIYEDKIIWHTCKSSWCSNKNQVVNLYIIPTN